MRGLSGAAHFWGKRTGTTLVIGALALGAIGLAVLLAYRGIFALIPPRQAEAPALPKIVRGATPTAIPGQFNSINAWDIAVVDGDTIRANGLTIRLVGFDAPETGNQARCPREREIAARATAQLQALVNGGGLQLRLVRCACPPGTEGTSVCNHGRACGELRSRGRDVGSIMITYLLAHPYICGAHSCPPRKSWC